jgi:hypothetical protein
MFCHQYVSYLQRDIGREKDKERKKITFCILTDRDREEKKEKKIKKKKRRKTDQGKRGNKEIFFFLLVGILFFWFCLFKFLPNDLYQLQFANDHTLINPIVHKKYKDVLHEYTINVIGLKG